MTRASFYTPTAEPNFVPTLLVCSIEFHKRVLAPDSSDDSSMKRRPTEAPKRRRLFEYGAAVLLW
jgi:hypothetical protein